jgi:copper chaperone CopZ
MNTTTKSGSKTWMAGLFAALAASLCCITPVLALFSGATGIASTFSWLTPYRPYLIGLTIAILAFAWYQKLKPKRADIDCACETKKPSFWQGKTFLAMVTVLAFLLMAFPKYAQVFYPKAEKKEVIVVDKSDIQTVQLNISGMDCEACTAGINSNLLRVNGVIDATTSYEKANAIVKFDNSKTSVDSIANAVNETGYKVVSTKTIR